MGNRHSHHSHHFHARGVRYSREIEVKYLVLQTGYTSRIPDDANEKLKEYFEGETIVCTKDDRWGARERRGFIAFVKTYKMELKAIKEFHDEHSLDGTAVMRVNEGNFGRALSAYHEAFGSDNDGAYCGFFHGIPCETQLVNHAHLGLVLIMRFDCESG